jgi:hypothetical protein
MKEKRRKEGRKMWSRNKLIKRKEKFNNCTMLIAREDNATHGMIFHFTTLKR